MNAPCVAGLDSGSSHGGLSRVAASAQAPKIGDFDLVVAGQRQGNNGADPPARLRLTLTNDNPFHTHDNLTVTTTAKVRRADAGAVGMVG